MNETPCPTRYRVVVRGRLSQRLAAGFDGISVESGDGQTTLTGCYLDQAQLHGVLDRLRALGIELVSVNVAS